MTRGLFLLRTLKGRNSRGGGRLFYNKNTLCHCLLAFTALHAPLSSSVLVRTCAFRAPSVFACQMSHALEFKDPALASEIVCRQVKYARKIRRSFTSKWVDMTGPPPPFFFFLFYVGGRTTGIPAISKYVHTCQELSLGIRWDVSRLAAPAASWTFDARQGGGGTEFAVVL